MTVSAASNALIISDTESVKVLRQLLDGVDLEVPKCRLRPGSSRRIRRTRVRSVCNGAFRT